VSGDEERSSISSSKSSNQRDAAQAFTTIQRTVRPGTTLSKSLIMYTMYYVVSKVSAVFLLLTKIYAFVNI